MSFNLAVILQESAAATPHAPLLYQGDATLTSAEVATPDC
ncbi:long-chain acyl-CoA synthetase [Gordonia hydrophobica]|nr:long-chain acyl-CoA synthetase [Gordonia hydrophobica]